MDTYTLHIHHSLHKRLRARAAEEQKPIEQVIVDYLDEHMPDLDESNFAYSLAKMAERFDLRSGRSDISEHFDEVLNNDVLFRIAQSADSLGQQSESGDISTHSRDILRTEYPDELAERTRKSDH